MTGLRALLLLALLQSGCVTTAGRDWLAAPVEPGATLLPPNAETKEPVSEAPPRLNHVVTLGESYATYPAPRTAAAGPAVQVNVPVTINNYAGGYGSYGYGYGYGGYPTSSRVSAAPLRTTAATSQKVGADFPAVPSYGPRALR